MRVVVALGGTPCSSAFVVCGGGGGVPVVRSNSGELTGVEAVVDKDLTAAELAITIKADRLLVLTDVRPSFAVTARRTRGQSGPSTQSRYRP